MARASFQAEAPGKLMLMGEHAVLHGRRALVCAINRRWRVTLRPRTDGRVVIVSALGRLDLPLENLAPRPPFAFILAALSARRAQLPGGCDLAVEADSDAVHGLGSSSAVTVATVAALRAWLGEPVADREALFAESVCAVRAAQGRASGADVAAGVYGGVLAYRMTPCEATPLGRALPLVVAASGHKEATTDVVARVERGRADFPRLYDGIYDLMDACVGEAIAAIAAEDWPRLGRLVNLHQGLMDALGLVNPPLAALVQRLRALPGVHGAKVSGAGLGDCVYGIGSAAPSAAAGLLDLSVSPYGVRVS